MTTNIVKVLPSFLEKKAGFQEVREAWNGLMEGAYVCFMGHEVEWLTTSLTTADLDGTIQGLKERKRSGDRASVLSVTLIDARRAIFEIRYRCGFWQDEAFIPSADEIRRRIAEVVGAHVVRQMVEVLAPPSAK